MTFNQIWLLSNVGWSWKNSRFERGRCGIIFIHVDFKLSLDLKLKHQEFQVNSMHYGWEEWRCSSIIFETSPWIHFQWLTIPRHQLLQLPVTAVTNLRSESWHFPVALNYLRMMKTRQSSQFCRIAQLGQKFQAVLSFRFVYFLFFKNISRQLFVVILCRLFLFFSINNDFPPWVMNVSNPREDS